MHEASVREPLQAVSPATPSPIPHLTPNPFCSLLRPPLGQVLSESDLDNDNMLSFSEFEHAMAKAPDFMK